MTPTPPESRPGILRYLFPSVGDLIFLVTFWALLMGPLSNRPLADSDIGWHIRTGEQILATHSVPHVDSFSFTMRGQPWFAWEWLYDVILGIVHRAMGLNGVVWLAALLMASTFAILLRQLLARGTGLPVAIVLWLLALGAASIHAFARPHIVSWLFTLVWFLALERWQRGNASLWLPWFFPVSVALWVNLHGGWLLGMALFAIYVISAGIESWRSKDAIARIQSAARARAMGWMLVLSALATVLNPYGLQLHEHIYRYLGDPYLMNRIAEFRSPDFHGWGQRCFVVILLLVFLAVAGRSVKMRVSHWLITLLMAWAGVYAVRNVPVSAMLLTLIIGPSLWESVAGLAESPGAWRRVRSVAQWLTGFASRASAQELSLRGHLWPLVGVAVALSVCLHGGRIGSQVFIQHEFDREHFPSRAIDYLLAEKSTNPVFEPDQWGGYFIYRLYPGRMVLIDDRHDLYGSARFRDYLILMQGEPGWRDVLAKWNIKTVVVQADSTLRNLLGQLPHEWATVYEDRTAVVMEKKSAGD
jgi:hypothetical protein